MSNSSHDWIITDTEVCAAPLGSPVPHSHFFAVAGNAEQFRKGILGEVEFVADFGSFGLGLPRAGLFVAADFLIAGGLGD